MRQLYWDVLSAETGACTLEGGSSGEMFNIKKDPNFADNESSHNDIYVWANWKLNHWPVGLVVRRVPPKHETAGSNPASVVFFGEHIF